MVSTANGGKSSLKSFFPKWDSNMEEEELTDDQLEAKILSTFGVSKKKRPTKSDK